MVLLDQLWDDVVAGPQPERGLKQLKRVYTTHHTTTDGGEGSGIKYQRSLSMPASPGSPEWGSPTAGKRDNVWRSVFNPGSNLATKNIGSDYFDKAQPHAPTTYDWLYSGETRSKHR